MRFGPGGPITPAVKALLITNVALYLLTLMSPAYIISTLGLSPAAVFGEARIWQVVSYNFIHSPGSVSHILLNMLAVWMFGVELERRWGTPFFTKFYFVCGIGAGVSTLLVSLLPFDATAPLYYTTTIGASGAVYGVLMAWALIFPHREILFMFLFPLKARVFVLIVGAIAFLSALSAAGGPVASVAHLGGLVTGWLYLKGPRNIPNEIRRQIARWRMNRLRRRFDVHKGGRDYWNDRTH